MSVVLLLCLYDDYCSVIFLNVCVCVCVCEGEVLVGCGNTCGLDYKAVSGVCVK